MGANALVARQNTSAATNSAFNLTETGAFVAYAETAGYFIALGDKVTGTVKRSFVEYLFGKRLSQNGYRSIQGLFFFLELTRPFPFCRKRTLAGGAGLGYTERYNLNRGPERHDGEGHQFHRSS